MFDICTGVDTDNKNNKREKEVKVVFLKQKPTPWYKYYIVHIQEFIPSAPLHLRACFVFF